MKSRNPWVTVFRWISIVLIVILAVQILVLLWQLVRGTGSQADQESMDAEEISIIDNQTKIDTFTEVIDRPLFSWNRRPEITGELEELADGAVLAAKWRLTGLVNTSDSTYAVFSEVDGYRRVRLESGMSLDNWSVKELDTEQVTLVNGEEKVVLRLSVTDTPQLETERTEIQGKDVPDTDDDAEPRETEE